MHQTQIHSKAGAKREAGLSTICARLISDLVNPLVIPPAVIFATGSMLSLSSVELGWITIISLLFFTLIPFAIAYVLLQSGQIQSLDIPERKNRNKLFKYSILSSSAGSIVLILLCLGRHQVLAETALVFFLNPIFGFFINQKFKISIHTAAIATAGALFCVLYFNMPEVNVWAGIFSLFMLLILLPTMVWSRFQLGIHSYKELAGGVFAGIVLTLLEISIMHIIL